MSVWQPVANMWPPVLAGHSGGPPGGVEAGVESGVRPGLLTCTRGRWLVGGLADCSCGTVLVPGRPPDTTYTHWVWWCSLTTSLSLSSVSSHTPSHCWPRAWCPQQDIYTTEVTRMLNNWDLLYNYFLLHCSVDVCNTSSDINSFHRFFLSNSLTPAQWAYPQSILWCKTLTRLQMKIQKPLGS